MGEAGLQEKEGKGRKRTGNGVQVFYCEKTNQAMNSISGNDKSKGVEGKRRREDSVGEEKKENLEVGVACHLLLGLESLVKAKEHIFLVTIGPPISTSLY